jgi:ABC-type hemin transport system ATPase subunit
MLARLWAFDLYQAIFSNQRIRAASDARIVMLDAGRIVADGSVRDVLRRTVLEEVYAARFEMGEAVADNAA